MSDVKFRIPRSPVPIIWLDTSVLIKRARIRAGADVPAADRDRVQHIHENVYQLVRAGKLICPEANQPSEVWHNRDAFSDAVHEYSLGVRTSHPRLVQDRQEMRAMRAYAKGEGSIELPCLDLFSSDPTVTLRENLSHPIFISIAETPSVELIQQLETDHTSIHQKWEALRIRLIGQRVTYARQLQVELQGEINTIFELAQAYLDKSENGEEPLSSEFFQCMRVVSMIAEWDGLTNGDLDIAGLRRFFCSPHYVGLPSIFISAALTASLLTDSRPIKSGDAKDVEHIAMMFPYADLMIVDGFMKHLITKLGFPKKIWDRCM